MKLELNPATRDRLRALRARRDELHSRWHQAKIADSKARRAAMPVNVDDVVVLTRLHGRAVSPPIEVRVESIDDVRLEGESDGRYDFDLVQLSVVPRTKTGKWRVRPWACDLEDIEPKP